MPAVKKKKVRKIWFLESWLPLYMEGKEMYFTSYMRTVKFQYYIRNISNNYTPVNLCLFTYCLKTSRSSLFQ